MKLTEEDSEFVKDYKTNIMTNIYDNRDELKRIVKVFK